METFQKTLEDFRNYLNLIGYSKSTLQKIPSCVSEFLEFVKADNLKKITPQEIRCFHDYLQSRPNKRREGGLSDMMIIQEIYALKLFFHFLLETGHINKNPMSNYFFKKNKPKERVVLKIDEIKCLFDVARNLEEVVILHLFYSCGLRRTEAVKLNCNDVHFREGIVYVREGKGNQSRAIPVTPKVAEDLKNYYFIEREKVIKRRRNPAAFVLNSSGCRMRGDTFYKRFKKLLEISQISKNISLHHLRHSIATHLLENKMGYELVKDFLGHRHFESTQIYTHISNQQIQEL